MATLQARQTVQQRLLMAPNLTVALEILRMPTMELQTFLRQQVEENPLLELDDSYDEPSESAVAESSGGEEPAGPSLDEEWSAHWRTAGEMESHDEQENPEAAGDDPRHLNPLSLYESLRLQLGCQRLPEEQRRLGEALIDRLDENGYLADALEELAGELGTDQERLETVLTLIQRLDPPGVGARNLRECLMLQLERRLPAPPVGGAQADLPRQAGDECGALAYRVLQDHFELFVQHRLRAIARALNAPLEEVEATCECLKGLNPRPGRMFTGELPPSVVPDLVIRKREEHEDVEFNDEHLPRLRVNRRYHQMLRSPDTPSEVKEFLQERFRQASWVIKAIEERTTTLLAIARCLISLQREFVEHGPKALKPLTQAQVASLVGRHPSTVSRAITGKTIDTPHGIFRLEQLFASRVPQPTENGHVSDETIKSEIQRLIAQEDAAHPLSDAALARQLGQREIAVARRTIAKYRTNLRILPAHLRKRRA